MPPFGAASIFAKPDLHDLPVSQAHSPLNMGSTHDAHGIPHQGTLEKTGNAHPPSHAMIDDASDHDENQIEVGDERNDPLQPADDKRKRRRSRKGLDKRYECTAEGCGKSYSRAEHLYRHQLNHNSKQIFHCEYPDCPRTFVRGDLLKRHMDRHTAKGSQLNRRNSTASRAPPVASPTLASPDISRAPMPDDSGQAQGEPQERAQAPAHVQASQAQVEIQAPTLSQTNALPQSPHHSHDSFPSHNSHPSPSIHSPQPSVPVAIAPAARYSAETPSAYPDSHISEHPRDSLLYQGAVNGGRSSAAPTTGPIQPSIQTNLRSVRMMPSALHQQGYHNHGGHVTQSAGFVPHPQNPHMSFNLPPAPYPPFPASTAPLAGPLPYATTTSAEFTHASELALFDHMALQNAAPIFGEEGYNKSPYVGTSEDFMVYLFNSLPQNGSPAPQVLPPPLLNFGDLNDHFSASHLDQNGAVTLFGAQPQQVMAVNNLLGQEAPEATITEHRSQQVFDYIFERFRLGDNRLRENILTGNRAAGDHLLSRAMMSAYIRSYWHHFSEQMPILHKPTFTAEKTPNALLIAIMAIGAACLDRHHAANVPRAGTKISNFLAENLRWEIFMDPNFRPPATLWIFQTLILLELYEKMFSTRELHERAHIHHATTITLMRRGRSLIGKSALDSPPHVRDGGEGSRKSSSSGIAHTPDEWWNHWITNEATRRAAFAAFVIDSTHATMFGHSAVMVAHEMRLPLPCDESLWKASSSAEVGRVEANLMSRGIKPIAFLEGLKRTLSHQEVRTTSFGRTVLMAGLLSVTYHMHQRDLQVNILGGGVIQALGGRDKWRATLTRAYDSWKSEFDAALEQSEPSCDPYGHDAANHEFNIIVESRTVLHHLAHMAMHADIVDCQIYAHAKQLLGRTIGSQEFNSAQRRIKDFWAPSARARDAAYYALKFLCSVLVPNHPERASQPVKPYSIRDDDLLNRPWVLYFAALVIWCYGFAIEGPCPELQAPSNYHEKWQQTRAYLTRYGSITDPNELREMRGINGTTALLMVLRDSFEMSQWELLHEAAALLQNCIILNYGSIP